MSVLRYFSYFLEPFKLGDITDNTNVNVMTVGDQLYAMTESGFINRVDMDTLERQRKVITIMVTIIHLLQRLSLCKMSLNGALEILD